MIRALRKKGLTYRSIADLCGYSHGSVHSEILAMKKEESEKQKILDEENTKKLAEESLLAQASPQQSESQELSNPQDNKISDSYTYYETID
jgi:cyanate lyase